MIQLLSYGPGILSRKKESPFNSLIASASFNNLRIHINSDTIY